MLRIYDANFNRCSEGLRVLEETARFLLNDSELTKDLKHLRHQLAKYYTEIEPQLLTSRDSVNDVGIKSDLPTEYARGDTGSIVTANARRVQESLRVLEEYSKLAGTSSINAYEMEQMRFSLYQLEQELTSKVMRKEKANCISGVYLILDHGLLRGRSETEVAQQAIDGGAKIIQLRDKQRNKSEILKTARELKQLCVHRNVLFMMNDYVDIALAADADGVHLGHDDLPVNEARKLMPIDKIIGCTTVSVDEAVQAQQQGVDYLAVGSIYPTQSKEIAAPVGINTLGDVNREITLPVVATGGINMDNIKHVLDAGANAIAVISVILNSDNIMLATSKLVSHFEMNRGG